MLSRRNIRIKIMQVLYAKSRDKAQTDEQVLSAYNESIALSYELYLFNLSAFTQVAKFSQIDLANRESKLLPTEADKNFSPKLGTNKLIDSLVTHKFYNEQLNENKINEKIEKENIRSIYNEFLKEKDFKKYLDKESCEQEDHKKILLNLYKFCTKNELFVAMIDDEFNNWIDDKSLIVGAIKKTLKALPAKAHFLFDYLPGEDTTKDFGEKLIRKVIDDNEELLEIIEPNLKNWDAERVAIIDMILLKMAIAELLIFPTIPTKVTLNEFVEISKIYSTDKSKDFINGILDRLLKKLEQEGKILKEGRGLVE